MINYGYFRHRFDAHENAKLNTLADEMGVIIFGYYYTLLELYGARYSKKEDDNEVEIHARVIANTWRKRVDSVHLVLTKLQLSGLLVYTKCENTYSLRIPNFAKYYGSYKKTESQNRLSKGKESKGKESKGKKEKKVVDYQSAAFDFETVYAAYPRKAGKEKGFNIFKRDITTENEYNNLGRSIKHYDDECTQTNTYFMHFSTFMNCWEDYIETDRSRAESRASELLDE